MQQGVAVYGNKAAFESLAAWMRWIAQSHPSKHNECHLVWHLLSHSKTPNVSVLVDRSASRVFGRGGKRLLKNFELTFMAVEPSDLKKLRRFKRSGLLPEGWTD
jgi:hypothetical protein